MLEYICSSILSFQIFDPNIGDVLKKRHELREKILKEMSEDTVGSCVNLKTFEVKDVRILLENIF